MAIIENKSAGSSRRVVVEAKDGVRRTFEGKRFDQHKDGLPGAEFRVYRVEGDITNREALKDSAEQLAVHFDVQRVTLRI